MSNIANDRKLVAAVANVLERAGRIGIESDNFCACCGADWSETGGKGFYSSEFQAAFRCANRPRCVECIRAMESVAKFLRELFAAKIVSRADSVRGRLARLLDNAAVRVCRPNKKDWNKLTIHDFAFFVSGACPFEDSESEFRSKILGAFEGTGFCDFQGLSAQLEIGKSWFHNRDLERAMERAASNATTAILNMLDGESVQFYE